MKIRHIVKIVNNYEKLNLFQSKNYYKMLIKKEIFLKYKYTLEIIEKFSKLFPFQEFVEFLLHSQINRPLSIRFNTLKKSPKDIFFVLVKKKIKIFFLKNLYNLVGIVKQTKMKICAIPEYLAGLYTIQSISSFFSVICMNIKKNEKILDLAAAPGSKTTLISQVMNNTGIVVANDINFLRIKSLIGNIHRLGVKNTVIINYNGILLNKYIKGFDKVLIDAPCTGTGILSHDNTIKISKIKSKIMTITRLQKKLLLSAIDMCNQKSINGGTVLYSTCSILVEENECVIEYALNKKRVEILATHLGCGMPGYVNFDKNRFNKNMNKCVRFFPHIHNTDGFFICKLKKLEN
ncbi:nucleolar protein (nucleomorph) [Cryptomonas paramecium]|uniref:Nucleolar protein n=1 Tax=Cryptomonas paramaecium TaxID=2898 RepID=F2HHQ9_9CRYP|nr:nucleolar protein [Cryptomonas paramecium]AEA38855.1 nucleolar protein [Cryptomonas paramecium]|mmetsp:Transcript_5591/g.17867  ORF Transcript_5591/g.17867 Transcript_5591/m.17867 type:complete len:349 (+) Transcript_5591:79-1125(+)